MPRMAPGRTQATTIDEYIALPRDLIRRIVAFRVAENLARRGTR
jgi:hypothetical protein